MLKRIVSIGLICLFLIGGMSCAAPAPPAPPGPSEEEIIPKGITFLDLTATELKRVIFDERLVPAQREEIWNNQYKGKGVKWMGYLGEKKEEALTFYPSGIKVEVSFDKPITEDLRSGVYYFAGILDNYCLGYIGGFEKFQLKNGVLGKIVWEKMWEYKTPPSSGTYFSERYGLIGVDSQYCYFWWDADCLEQGDRKSQYVAKIFLLNKTNSYFVSEKSFPFWASWAWMLDETRQEAEEFVKNTVISIADKSLVLAQSPPFEIRVGNFIFKSERWGLYDYRLAVYNEKGEELWGEALELGVTKILVFDQVFYISSPSEVEVYRLYTP